LSTQDIYEAQDKKKWF